MDFHPAGKQLGCDGDHPRAFAATVKNEWSCVSILPYYLWHDA